MQQIQPRIGFPFENVMRQRFSRIRTGRSGALRSAFGRPDGCRTPETFRNPKRFRKKCLNPKDTRRRIRASCGKPARGRMGARSNNTVVGASLLTKGACGEHPSPAGWLPPSSKKKRRARARRSFVPEWNSLPIPLRSSACPRSQLRWSCSGTASRTGRPAGCACRRGRASDSSARRTRRRRCSTCP